MAKDWKQKLIEYGKIVWKWIRFIFRTRAAAWLISTFLVPAIVSYAASKGIDLPEEVVKETIKEITGLILEPEVALAASIATAGAALTTAKHTIGTKSAEKERRNYYHTKYDEKEANRRLADWIEKKKILRESLKRSRKA